MSNVVGEIHCINAKKVIYAIIIKKSQGIDPTYSLAYLIEAKPYESDSPLCLRSHLKMKKPKDAKLPAKLMVSKIPFVKINLNELKSYNGMICTLAENELNTLLEILSDRDALRAERARLSSIKNELHSQLSDLKKKKLFCQFHNQNYTEIYEEMSRIASKLGYTYTPGHKKEGFREAPSKYIKVYQGGRGG